MRIGENNRVTKKGIEVSTSIIWSEFHSLFRFRFGEKPEKGNGVNCIMFNTEMLNVGRSNLIGYAPWMIQKRNDIIWLPSLMRLANILSHSCVRAHWYKANKRHEACEMFTKRITECFLQKWFSLTVFSLHKAKCWITLLITYVEYATIKQKFSAGFQIQLNEK